ncbi:uncharacterized protein Z519_09341 [Cladophialophora bantiana CBS 173.52]|uniref:Uncharacterized protein n=1 Tax=Cladophialophora bantiana (strain ATCC 10958 / CBS 173.52 / CDC B-1940 / NIH 8579) TaxID=1442370 RepID=A0A0D2FTP5_CLAB1|nr:uncharacterized protein Z519_09341 [Cladophialophora bantiana CBS 173.52]KIW89912.1 hypothetical protein Z519_09341 [Cladophialophora bantiana CBS 173.52]
MHAKLLNVSTEEDKYCGCTRQQLERQEGINIIAFILAILTAVWPLYLRYKRARAAKEATNTDGEIPSEEDHVINDASTLETPKQKEHPYYESSGYEATLDQNQTLLGNAEGAPITH